MKNQRDLQIKPVRPVRSLRSSVDGIKLKYAALQSGNGLTKQRKVSKPQPSAKQSGNMHKILII